MEAKEARKEAEKNLKSVRHQYQPIKEKHKKQEELITAFKAMEVVRRFNGVSRRSIP